MTYVLPIDFRIQPDLPKFFPKTLAGHILFSIFPFSKILIKGSLEMINKDFIATETILR